MEDNSAGVKAGYGPGSARAGKQEAGASQMVTLACSSLCPDFPTTLSVADRAAGRDRKVLSPENCVKPDLARFTGY